MDKLLFYHSLLSMRANLLDKKWNPHIDTYKYYNDLCKAAGISPDSTFPVIGDVDIYIGIIDHEDNTYGKLFHRGYIYREIEDSSPWCVLKKELRPIGLLLSLIEKIPYKETKDILAGERKLHIHTNNQDLYNSVMDPKFKFSDKKIKDKLFSILVKLCPTIQQPNSEIIGEILASCYNLKNRGNK